MRSTARPLAAMLVLLCAACNLQRAAPLPPTAAPTGTATATRAPGVIEPSITPLDLSTPTTGSACAAPPGWIVYIVIPGDTLSDLAEATGTTVAAIAQANCIDPAQPIQPGQPLALPTDPVVG